MKPDLSLVMIVKNEAHGIVKTLESALPYCSRFDILDTGSTDNTVELIAQFQEEHYWSGAVSSEPFVDFATTRNRALALAQDTCWALMLSGDEEISAGSKLPDLDRQPALAAWNCPIYFGDYRYMHPRITRAGWAEYQGKTHERVEIHGDVENCGFGIRSGRREDRTNRLCRDLEILLVAFQNPRRDFYLAQTYQSLCNDALAVYWYKSCLYATRDLDERFETLLRLGNLTHETKYLLDAKELRPARPESYFYLSQEYRHRGLYGLARKWLWEAEARAKLHPNLTGLVHLNAYQPRLKTERIILKDLLGA
jgi:glycosyltransferase involved in cell wall biosynthesis